MLLHTPLATHRSLHALRNLIAQQPMKIIVNLYMLPFLGALKKKYINALLCLCSESDTFS